MGVAAPGDDASGGQPAVSDIYQSLRTGEPAIAVGVPMPTSIGPGRVLTARLDPAALSRLLADQGQRPMCVGDRWIEREHLLEARQRIQQRSPASRFRIFFSTSAWRP